MAGLARTCVLVSVCAAGLLAACGHLPFEELPDQADNLSTGDSGAGGGPADGSGGLRDGTAGDDGGQPPPRDGGDGLDADARDGSAVDATMPDGGCLDECNILHVSTIGKDSADGSIERPLRTIQAAIDRADVVRNIIHVAGGKYDESLTIGKKLALKGGYLCDSAKCDWNKRDVVSWPTIVEPTAHAPGTIATLVVKEPCDNGTLVDGLTAIGFSGPGATAAIPSATAAAVIGATPDFENVKLEGGVVTDSAGVAASRRSIGLFVAGTTHATQSLIVGTSSVLTGGPSSSASVGVWLDKSSGPAARVLVTNSVIAGGDAPTSLGVMANASDPQSLFEHDDISSRPSNSSGEPASWGVQINSSLRLWRNKINVDADPETTYCSNPKPCGGVLGVNATQTDLQSNIIYGLPAPVSIALHITATSGHTSNLVVNGNLLRGSGLKKGGGQLAAAIGVRIDIGASSNVAGSVRNNILLGGNFNPKRYGVLELNDPQTDGRPKALTNNDFWDVDVTYQAWSTADGKNTNYDVVNAPPPLAEVSANLFEDPKIGADFHLADDSPCIGKGIFKEITSLDIDNEKRKSDNPVEIGPDERTD